MKTVLITGAYGFIGRQVAREFKDGGYYVIGIGHGSWNDERFSDFGLDKFIQADIDINSLKKIQEDINVVVHCAGGSSVGKSIESPMTDFKNTVDTTLSVLEFIRETNKDIKLIYTSSAAVYGCREDEKISEDSDLAPVSPYGLYKKMSEELCRLYFDQYGVRSNIVRFFSLYGPGLKKQLLWDACNKISGNKQAEFWGTGLETRDWLHVNDAAKLMRLLSENSQDFCILNGGSGIKSSINYVLNNIAKQIDGQTEIIFNNKSRAGDPKYYWADTNKAFELGWKPQIKLEKGISDYVNWYKNL